MLHVVRELGLIRDEHIGFRPRHSTSQHLALLVERITKNFGKKGSPAVLFYEGKAFYTV